MKATKAYIASAGTTGLLVASSMSLLVLVGAILAFNGWPNSGLAEDVERFFVGDDEPSVLVPGAVSQSVDTAADATGSVVGDESLGADVDAVADFDPAADDGSPLGGGVPGAGTPGAGTPGDGTPGVGTPVAGTPGGAPEAGGSAPQIGLPVNVPGVNPEPGSRQHDPRPAQRDRRLQEPRRPDAPQAAGGSRRAREGERARDRTAAGDVAAERRPDQEGLGQPDLAGQRAGHLAVRPALGTPARGH